MAKSKTVRMPAGIRSKLTAAIAMLLVSTIMMVSSTYAWFTLSTAPEVTGITTSVGANGNLEMALLSSATFDGEKVGDIASAVGDSSANPQKTVQQANITWGNLVDLSDAGYGLQLINLQPARLNMANATTLASATSLLLKPVYGKDGRVAELSSETYATIYTANTGWAFDAEHPQYGVRAIGANDNLSPQEAGLIAAKVAYNRNLTNAKNAVQGALSDNGNDMASALTTLTMSDSTNLNEDQQAAIDAMIDASEDALNYIDAAYKQVLLGLASAVEDATAYSAAVSTINEATSYEEALEALKQQADVNLVVAGTPLATAVDTLNTQKAAVAEAKRLYEEEADYIGALSLLVDTDLVKVNGFDSGEIKEGDEINSDFVRAVMTAGGVVVEMPDDSGVFAYVGSVAGNYSASCLVDITLAGQDLTGMPATMQTVATVDSKVGTALNAVQPAAGTGDATVLSDTFGYALDFAFRTNAAESYLLLQTAAAQRVYSDSESAATQGAGSTMTFQVTKTDAGVATLTNEQVINLMGAIRVAFIDPTEDSGKIYGIAALTDITETADGFTGNLYLHDYTVDDDTGVMTLSGVKAADPDTGVDGSAIMKLDQSIAAPLTVVVWLDGDMVDNADVANAAQSLVGSMNLQFSSSAELIPMQNTALENMTITYTELDGNEYKVGLYDYNGKTNVLKDGYKLYAGSDNTLYFSNDETNYTKLTIMNYTTAMTPLTVSVTGNASIELQSNTTLTAKSSGGTIKTVTWTTSNSNVAYIDVNEVPTDATVLLGAKSVGTSKITATMVIDFVSADGSVTVTKENVVVEFNVTVGAYTVSFDANGGSGTMDPVVIAGSYELPSCTFTAPENTADYTYSFGGWKVGEDTKKVGDLIDVAADTVLTAVWIETPVTPDVGEDG